MASYWELVQACATSVLKGQLPSKEIMKMFVSKSLGFGILAGACITKVPQISAVVRSGSAAGLSPLSFELEALGLMIHTTYGALAGLPFNAYGEAAILCAQSLLLLVLIYRLSGQPALRVLAVLGALGAFAASVVTGRIDLDMIRVAFDANNVIFMAARLPQIYSNFRNKGTGQLSLTTCAINVVGCCVRIFTSLTEGAGQAMVRSYIISLLLNGMLVTQILVYKPKAVAGSKSEAAKKKAQ